MSQKEVLDLENENADEIDDERQDRPPAGVYCARVKEIKDDDKHPGGKIFRFTITDRPWAGCSVLEWLTAVSQGRTPESQRRIKQRRILFAKRLGLLDASANGQCVEIDWDAAIGQPVVIKAKEEEQDGKPRTRLEWDGIYRADDPRVADLLGGQATTTTSMEQPVQPVAPARPVPRAAAVDYGSL